MRLAIGHAALAAPPGLLGRLLARVLAVDLAEIRAAQMGGRFSGMSRSTVTNFSIRCLAMADVLPRVAPRAPLYGQEKRNKSQLY
jgi:hypothetical protein